MQPTKSVEEILESIERYRLLSSKDVAAVRERWLRPDRKEVADPERFRKWLVLNRYVTEFVAKVLSGRKPDQLILNQYRLVDQMISGPMAGTYVAIDPLDRRVAIEVLSAKSAADPGVLGSFQQAALKATKVQHPNVGRTLDMGEAHGFYYLVKEYFEGPTLEDILERRGKLPYQTAARLMALVLEGVEALHSEWVPAGDLAADCILLAPAGKGPANQRTVKILHAGVRRQLFDETAIGRSISLVQGIPDELDLAASSTFQLVEAGAANPPEDIFRLGCLFYRCVTGRAPYAEQQLPRPAQPAKPVAEVNPEVPEMLGQIIDEMIDPDAAKRPQRAAHVAKSLRVFLAADEESRETEAEENIAIHKAPVAAADSDVEVLEENGEEQEEEQEEEQQEVRQVPRLARKKVSAPGQGVWDKLVALKEEIHPEIRDLVFLAVGSLLMLALIFIVHLLTGLSIVFAAGLFAGAAATYFVEMFVRWRREKSLERS
jgi:serine/threonine protein kinase